MTHLFPHWEVPIAWSPRRRADGLPGESKNIKPSKLGTPYGSRMAVIAGSPFGSQVVEADARSKLDSKWAP
jgi:hypothetical protein